MPAKELGATSHRNGTNLSAIALLLSSNAWFRSLSRRFTSCWMSVISWAVLLLGVMLRSSRRSCSFSWNRRSRSLSLSAWPGVTCNKIWLVHLTNDQQCKQQQTEQNSSIPAPSPPDLPVSFAPAGLFFWPRHTGAGSSPSRLAWSPQALVRLRGLFVKPCSVSLEVNLKLTHPENFLTTVTCGTMAVKRDLSFHNYFFSYMRCYWKVVTN